LSGRSESLASAATTRPCATQLCGLLRDVAVVALAGVDRAAVSRRDELAAAQVCSIGDELD
jgi:hypothetical protein